jgi:hypothetical protein
MFLTEKTIDGLYSGRWEVGFEPYDGADFSRLCCLFSGQGSAVPGMFLSAYRERETVRQRFDEADALSRAAGLPPPSLYITEMRWWSPAISPPLLCRSRSSTISRTARRRPNF